MLSPTFDIRYEGLKAVATTDIMVDASGDDSYDITMTNLRGKTFTWPLVTNEDDLTGDWAWGTDDDDFWFGFFREQFDRLWEDGEPVSIEKLTNAV